MIDFYYYLAFKQVGSYFSSMTAANWVQTAGTVAAILASYGLAALSRSNEIKDKNAERLVKARTTALQILPIVGSWKLALEASRAKEWSFEEWYFVRALAHEREGPLPELLPFKVPAEVLASLHDLNSLPGSSHLEQAVYLASWIDHDRASPYAGSPQISNDEANALIALAMERVTKLIGHLEKSVAEMDSIFYPMIATR